MDILIGREGDSHRLLITVNNKSKAVGTPESVPATVSRKHCSIHIEENGDMSIRNLSDHNQTYVDGYPVLQKRITENSQVMLSASQYPLNLHDILSMARSIAPVPTRTYSLYPLKRVWESYHDTRMAMQLEEKRKANQSRLQSIFSMVGMVFAMVPYEMFFGEGFGWVGILFRIPFILISVCMGLFFYLRGRNLSNDILIKMDQLDKDFRNRYKCPNPDCPRFMGNQPYDVIEYSASCPLCHCKYTHENI